MRAQETSFEHLAQGQKQFQAALYQRLYSWTKNELEQLWVDILEQAGALRDGVANTAHFLGSVVLAPSPAIQASGVQGTLARLNQPDDAPLDTYYEFLVAWGRRAYPLVFEVSFLYRMRPDDFGRMACTGGRALLPAAA